MLFFSGEILQFSRIAKATRHLTTLNQSANRLACAEFSKNYCLADNTGQQKTLFVLNENVT